MKTFCTILAIVFLCEHASASSNTIEIKHSSDGSNSTSMCETIYINMYDTFGDGWNGATMTIYDWNNNAVWNGTMLTGPSASYNTCLWSGCYTIVVTNGSFPSEVSWVIDDGIYWLTDGVANSTTLLSLGATTTGCTDFSACNYNPGANCGDASCIYNDCIFLEMFDSGGNGWEGYQLSVLDNVGNVFFTTTLASGSYNYLQLGVPYYGCYRIQCTGGNSNWEVTWQMWYHDSTSGGQVVADQSDCGSFMSLPFYYSCNFGCVDEEACNYDYFSSHQQGACCYGNCLYLQMFGIISFGNSWGDFTITNWRGEVEFAGFDYEVDICLPDGCYQVTSTHGNGEYMSWNISDGALLYLTGLEGETHALQVGEIVEGCIDQTASNFNPLANCDGGVCHYNCDSDLDGNGVVNVGDLLIFTSEFGNVCD